MLNQFEKVGLDAFHDYVKWRRESGDETFNTPQIILMAYKVYLADMKLSGISTIRCKSYLDSKGYVFNLETIRRWYRVNCPTMEAAQVIVDQATKEGFSIGSTDAR